MVDDMKSENIPEGWKKVKLSEIAIITMGQSPSSKDCGIDADGMPFFQGNAEFGEKYPTPRLYTKKPLRVAKEGDILVSVRAPVGDVNINTTKSCIGRGISSIRPTNINREFLFYILKNKGKHFEKLQQGSTFKAINSDDLKEMEIALATPKEQEKIAEILSTVDENIEETDKIIVECERVKKGFMQKLLNEGIDNSEFEYRKFFGELVKTPKTWKKVKLKEICRLITDGKHGDCRNEDNSGYYFISAKDVYDGKIHYNEARQITKEDFEETHKRTRFEAGDIVLTNSGTIGKIATATDDDMTKRTTFQKSVAIIKPRNNKVLTKFLAFKLMQITKELTLLSFGSAQKNLLLKDLRESVIYLPEIEEQMEIESILQSMEERMEYDIWKKTNLLALKSALMQKLLSGKIRVKVD